VTTRAQREATEHAAAVYLAAVAWQAATARMYIRYENASPDDRAELDAAVSKGHMAVLDALSDPLGTDGALAFYDLIRDERVAAAQTPRNAGMSESGHWSPISRSQLAEWLAEVTRDPRAAGDTWDGGPR
jgi:uncharacterized protein YbjT (DUF2867 family)